MRIVFQVSCHSVVIPLFTSYIEGNEEIGYTFKIFLKK